MSSGLWLALVLLASDAPDGGVVDRPLRVEALASPTFGMELGVRSIRGISQVLFLYDDELSRRLAFDESSWPRRGLGIAGRALKLTLIDAALVLFLGTVEHEVFGHGARAREQGQWPGYAFSVPFPYRLVLSPSENFSGFAYYDHTSVPDLDLPVTAGGIEANVFSAHFQGLETFRAGGRMHYAESLHYLASLVSYLPRWADGGVLLGDRASGEDPDEYLRQLMQRFNRHGRAQQIDLSQRLRRGWLTTFLDPLWWISLYDVLVDYLWAGERFSVVPQFAVAGFKVFPLTRFNLSPFGGEHYLDLMISRSRFTLNLSARGASTGLAPSWGLGARLFRWQLHPAVELGASLDVWLQPELLPEYRNAYDGRVLPGLSGMIEASWRPLEHLALVAQLGGKSRGYVMSQPLAGGVFGFAGVALVDGVGAGDR